MSVIMYTGSRTKQADLSAGRKVEYAVDSHSEMARELMLVFLYLMPGTFDNLGVLLTAWNRSFCRVRK